jgi:hypothetical protein
MNLALDTADPRAHPSSEPVSERPIDARAGPDPSFRGTLGAVGRLVHDDETTLVSDSEPAVAGRPLEESADRFDRPSRVDSRAPSRTTARTV